MNPEILERLERAGIRVVTPDAPSHVMVMRDRCVAFLQREGEGIGSTGLFSDSGLSYLVWENGAALLVSKSGRRPASAEDVEQIQRFSADLKAAVLPLGSPEG